MAASKKDNCAKAKRACTAGSATGVPSEMEVVDTFTQLILGSGTLSDREQAILTALCAVDLNLENDLADAKRAGTYLRALGVTEMVRLVQKVRDYYGTSPLASLAGAGSPGAADRPLAT